MDANLEEMMEYRFQLTKISELKDNNPEESSSDVEDSNDSNFEPSIKYKEHTLSHLPEDIRNLGPLVLLNTNMFESKVTFVLFCNFH